MASQFLTLSLFLMLLSFFIILNGFSEFEEGKAQSAISSIAVAFSKQSTIDKDSPGIRNDDQNSMNKGTALDQLSAFFKAQISGIKVKKNRLGTEMRVRLKVSDFEKLLNATSQGNVNTNLQNRENLLPMLVSLMDTENQIPYRMDVLVHTSASPAKLQSESPRQVQASIKKASRYTQEIERFGLSRRLITAGLVEGESGMMDLIFKRYTPFDPSTQTKSASGDL